METPVLLLNATFEPITAVTLKRAIILVLAGKAEIIEEKAGEVVKSATLEMPRPSVIRLVRYVNVPRFRKAYLSRRNILSRDHYRCAYCGGKANTMDHVIPRSRGGPHTWENIVACCYPCNQRKDDKLLQEAGLHLDYRPYRPEGSKRILMIIGTSDPSWEPYLKMGS